MSERPLTPEPDFRIQAATAGKTDAEVAAQAEKDKPLPSIQAPTYAGLTRREWATAVTSAGFTLLVSNCMQWGCEMKQNADARLEKRQMDRRDALEAQDRLRVMEQQMPNWIRIAELDPRQEDCLRSLRTLLADVTALKRQMEELPFEPQERQPQRDRLRRLELQLEQAIDRHR